MMRYLIEISYLGTRFHGWQRQPNANTVQEEIEKALTLVLGQEISINGSSRTDTGVHARQQFAHFNTEILISKPHLLIKRLNKILDKEIAILRFIKIFPDKHTRFDALNRKYIYRISDKKDPFNAQITATYFQDFDINLMNQAAKLLLTHDDFESFSKVKTDVNTFLCKIESAFWLENNGILEFYIQSNRFLRGMVRAVVGTLMDVGKGKLTIVEFENIMKSKNRNLAGNAAKAEGLTLEEVNYPENYFDNRVVIEEATADDLIFVRALFEEYERFLGFSLCFQNFEEELNSLPKPYNKPDGVIIVAKADSKIVGVVALKKLEDGVCEMKRLYVQPAYQGFGIGIGLINEIMAMAKKMHYKTMKLDTLARLETAVKLYSQLGFVNTVPYNFNPQDDIMYFEKEL